jgi:hypothetical protein
VIGIEHQLNLLAESGGYGQTDHSRIAVLVAAEVTERHATHDFTRP